MTNEKLSPGLINATWKKENKYGVNHKTIYKFIWQAKFRNTKEYYVLRKSIGFFSLSNFLCHQ